MQFTKLCQITILVFICLVMFSAQGIAKSHTISFIQYGAFNDRYCGKYYRGTYKQIKEKYGNKLIFDFKHFLINSEGRKAEEASECARDQGKFWEMYEILFENQNALEISDLHTYAEKIGLDMNLFINCLDSGKKSELIDDHKEEAKKMGVSGSPTFFINGRKFVGAQPFANFQEVIIEELNRNGPYVSDIATGHSSTASNNAHLIQAKVDPEEKKFLAAAFTKNLIPGSSIVGEFNYDGTQLLLTSNPMELYKVSDWTETKLKSSFAYHSVRNVDFSPDGKYVAIIYDGTNSDNVAVWDLSNWKKVNEFKGPATVSTNGGSSRQLLIKISFSPDGRYLIAGPFDEGSKVWDVGTWEEVTILPGYKIKFTPDSKSVLTVVSDGKTSTSRMLVFDTNTWEETDSFAYGYVNAIEFSKDGNYFAFSSPGSMITVLDTDEWKKIFSWKAHKSSGSPLLGWMKEIAFSPDSNYLVTVTCGKESNFRCSSGEVKIWDISSQKEVAIFKGHSIMVDTVKFSPNGKYFSTGDRNNVLIWDFETILTNANLEFKLVEVPKILPKPPPKKPPVVTVKEVSKESSMPTPKVTSERIINTSPKIEKRKNGFSCGSNAECQSGNCKNKLCCEKGKICCKTDRMCKADEICRSVYSFCEKKQVPEQASEKSDIWLVIKMFLAATVLGISILAMFVFILRTFVYFDDGDEEEVMMVSEGQVESIYSKKIKVLRKYTRDGPYLIIVLKIINYTKTVITDVKINLDLPDGLIGIQPNVTFTELGVLNPNKGKWAKFKVKPEGKCVDGYVNGIVLFRDFQGKQHNVEMSSLKLVSICPMLEKDSMDSGDFLSLMISGLLKCNKTLIKYNGSTNKIFSIAKNRVRSLNAYDEDIEEKEGYISAYACYYGKTKYKDYKFVVEIFAHGTETNGCLSISVYSDEDAILTGFFSEIQEDIKQLIDIIEEKSTENPLICTACGADLDVKICDINGYHICEYCESVCKVADWLREI